MSNERLECNANTQHYEILSLSQGDRREHGGGSCYWPAVWCKLEPHDEAASVSAAECNFGFGNSNSIVCRGKQDRSKEEFRQVSSSIYVSNCPFESTQASATSSGVFSLQQLFYSMKVLSQMLIPSKVQLVSCDVTWWSGQNLWNTANRSGIRHLWNRGIVHRERNPRGLTFQTPGDAVFVPFFVELANLFGYYRHTLFGGCGTHDGRSCTISHRDFLANGIRRQWNGRKGRFTNFPCLLEGETQCGYKPFVGVVDVGFTGLVLWRILQTPLV